MYGVLEFRRLGGCQDPTNQGCFEYRNMDVFFDALAARRNQARGIHALLKPDKPRAIGG